MDMEIRQILFCMSAIRPGAESSLCDVGVQCGALCDTRHVMLFVTMGSFIRHVVAPMDWCDRRTLPYSVCFVVM